MVRSSAEAGPHWCPATGSILPVMPSPRRSCAADTPLARVECGRGLGPGGMRQHREAVPAGCAASLPRRLSLPVAAGVASMPSSVKLPAALACRTARRWCRCCGTPRSPRCTGWAPRAWRCARAQRSAVRHTSRRRAMPGRISWRVILGNAPGAVHDASFSSWPSSVAASAWRAAGSAPRATRSFSEPSRRKSGRAGSGGSPAPGRSGCAPRTPRGWPARRRPGGGCRRRGSAA